MTMNAGYASAKRLNPLCTLSGMKREYRYTPGVAR